MTNSPALREWIANQGYKLKGIASRLGITPNALHKKINNQSQFRVSEIAAFHNEFGMDLSLCNHIFFTTK